MQHLEKTFNETVQLTILQVIKTFTLITETGYSFVELLLRLVGSEEIVINTLYKDFVITWRNSLVQHEQQPATERLDEYFSGHSY